MATNLLTTDNTAATSATITNASAGDAFSVYLKGAYGEEDVPSGAYIWIQVQGDDGQWVNMYRLSSQSQPFFICEAVGSFRLNRPAQTYAIGAFQG